jgi:HEPN domain-containing protein
MKAITQEWLDRALDDLNSIEQLLKTEHLTNVVAFHAQQAVESRYPDDIGMLPYGKPTIEDAKCFYNFARDAYQQIKARLEITS